MTQNDTAVGDPVAEFERLVRIELAKGKDRPKAVIDAGLAHPQAHRAYIEATQATRKSQRLVAEKYD